MSARLRILGLLVAFTATATATACGSTQNLARLTVGASASSEILASLGQPRGKGVWRWAEVPEPREIWYYEHSKTDGSRVEMTMLLVFLKEGRYDGHLWFSAAKVVQQESW